MVQNNQLTHSTLVGIVSAVARIEDGSGNNVMDVNLSTQTRLQRYGRDIVTNWIYGIEITAPGVDTLLVSKIVSAGKVGHLYGIMISAQEANDFKIYWTNGGNDYSFRLIAGSMGTIIFTNDTSLFEGITADALSNVTIQVANPATAGKIYQAALLYAEV